MTTLISIDPGMSSGIAVGTYSDTEPFQLTHVFQIEGGLKGFVKNVRLIEEEYALWGSLHIGRKSFNLWDTLYSGCVCGSEDDDCDCPFDVAEEYGDVICEKFTPRPNGKGGLTLASVEPLRIEGHLVGSGVMPDYPDKAWRQPSSQYFMCPTRGMTLPEKKKAANRWLKENGFYFTGKDVGCKDADDARSATLHALSYLRKFHRPTQEKYFKEEQHV